jgi:hypothetical protein
MLEMKEMSNREWEFEAKLRTLLNGVSSEEASDSTIIDWLKCGDLRPLASLLLECRIPGQLVLTYLALMMLDEDVEGRVPYRLKAVPRKAGRPKRPENFVRDIVIHNLVDRRIKELGPGTYDSSIKDVAERAGLSERLVRNAYDHYAK